MMSPWNDSALATAASSRRRFLATGSMAALGTVVGTPGVSAEESAAESSAAAPLGPLIDARQLGAAGDGQTDDTEALQRAIRRAEQQGIGRVYLPGGVYVISDALTLPSDTYLVGAGAGRTTIQAAAGTLLPLYRPDPRTMDIRQRRSMVTTVTAGREDQRRIARSGLVDLTIDWNHCPTEGYGSSCVLIDRGDDCRLVGVTFTRCLPEDHPRRIDQMSGSAFRGECVMFSNSDRGLMDGCVLCDSGYRPLSVSYASQDITFQNGRIVATNPVWRHAFAEVHGDRMPRDDDYRRSQLKFINSSFFLHGGTAQDGICSHTGSLVIDNCDFHIFGGTEHFGYVIKPFDRSRRCHCSRSRFRCHGDYAETFRIFGSIGRPTNEDLVFSENMVDIRFAADSGRRVDGDGLVDLGVGQRRCRVSGNHFRIELQDSRPLAAIRIANGKNFTVSENLIDFVGQVASPQAIGVAIADSRLGTVAGNAVSGNFLQGLKLAGDSDTIALAGNRFEA